MYKEILNTVLGLCFFIVPFWAYRKGLKDGLGINQGKEIESIKTPLKMLKSAAQERKSNKEMDNIIEGFNNLMSYDGTPQGGDDE